MGSVPSTFATGYKYAGMGYTTAFDAAIPPLAARHAHEEFEDTPCIDKGFYVLMGNNHYVMQSIQQNEPREAARRSSPGCSAPTKGYAAKLVNPGGVEVWKQPPRRQRPRPRSTTSTTSTSRRGRSSSSVAHAAAELGLPHPVHIHCNNLGMPGNWKTTLETMKALEGSRGHITHIQFHSYGGGDGDENTFNSKVAPLAEYVNAHPNVTVDVGQVLFGETTSMTGDGPLGYYLSQHLQEASGSACDTEMEAGCGITPIKYRNKIARPRAAMGDRPGVVPAGRGSVARRDEHRSSERRLVPGLSADHPPADGPHLPPRTCSRRCTRSCASARSLGRPRPRVHAERNRHHHPRRPGPDSRPEAQGPSRHRAPTPTSRSTRRTRTSETMFELPRFVIKSGAIIVEQRRDPRAARPARRCTCRPSYDRERRSRHRGVVREVLLDPLPQLSRDDRLPARARRGRLHDGLAAAAGVFAETGGCECLLVVLRGVEILQRQQLRVDLHQIGR